MTKITNSKNVLFIEYWNLKFICNLVLEAFEIFNVFSLQVLQALLAPFLFLADYPCTLPMISSMISSKSTLSVSPLIFNTMRCRKAGLATSLISSIDTL